MFNCFATKLNLQIWISFEVLTSLWDEKSNSALGSFKALSVHFLASACEKDKLIKFGDFLSFLSLFSKVFVVESIPVKFIVHLVEGLLSLKSTL